jgi:hypothetical protein
VDCGSSQTQRKTLPREVDAVPRISSAQSPSVLPDAMADGLDDSSDIDARCIRALGG